MKLVFSIIFTSLILLAPTAFAAEFFTTWHADTYTPPSFLGKALPTSKSRIRISFDLIDQGKIVDLSRHSVRWYYKNNLIEDAAGMHTLSLVLPEFVSGNQNFRIEIPEYKGTRLAHSLNIPLVDPKIVIEPPAASQEVRAPQFKVRAHPYFFNVTDIGALNFAWKINGRVPDGNQSPEVLDININPGAPSGTEINLDLTVKNPVNLIEQARQSLRLIYAPLFNR